METIPTTTVGFDKLPIPATLAAHVAERGIINPTPVQEAVISKMVPELGQLLEGDLLAQARTGSGKTLAFLLPVAGALDSGTITRAWIVCPTRELAQQVAREAAWLLGEACVATLVGGAPFGPQLRELRGQPPVVVGTPGRMADHLRQETLEVECDVLILDEADRMLDLGFKEELDQVVGAAGEDSARWFFSATYEGRVQAAAGDWLRTPTQIRLDAGKGSSHVPQSYVIAPYARREEALGRLVDMLEPTRAIVFVRTRVEVEQVVQGLLRHGIHAEGLSGDLAQVARERALSRFREGRVTLLVATDVAARGLDVPGISHVFNLGLPDDLSNFVHRVGRTARAGAEGEAWSVLAPQERGRFLSISRQSEYKPEQRQVPTSRELTDKRRERLAQRVMESLGEGLELPESFKPLIEEHGAEAVLAAMVHKLVPEPPPEEPRRPQPRPEYHERGAGDRPERPRPAHRGREGVWLALSLGTEDGIEVRNLIPFVCRAADIPSSELGRIEMMPRLSLVETTPEAAELLLKLKLKWQRRPVRIREAEPPKRL
ncbi:MAG: DEAD/DEAH box helicase [Fibrobacteres bacterium]|nr:DEAD/DEAH box helicase [Fibrobacterota bacterium]QQS05091.1 MAG: DEAD/DEAH box helicase [Fibrobacterota bacterium]